VVDPFHGASSRRTLADEMHPLLKSFGMCGLVAAVPTISGTGRHVRTLGEWGGAEIVSSTGSAAELRKALMAMAVQPWIRLIRRAAPTLLPARADRLLMAAAKVAAQVGTAQALGRHLYVSERTLFRQCESAGLPPPSQLLRWLRILRAAELLDTRKWPVEVVGIACGYADAASFRRGCYALVQCGPRSLRQAGALDTVAEAFRRALAETSRRAPHTDNAP
jgi:AraC-like DNA-binding protein